MDMYWCDPFSKQIYEHSNGFVRMVFFLLAPVFGAVNWFGGGKPHKRYTFQRNTKNIVIEPSRSSSQSHSTSILNMNIVPICATLHTHTNTHHLCRRRQL